MNVRSFPSAPMNKPTSKITLSRGVLSVTPNLVMRSSGVTTRIAKSYLFVAVIRASSVPSDKPKAPWVHTLQDAVGSKHRCISSATHKPLLDEPINTLGFAGTDSRD